MNDGGVPRLDQPPCVSHRTTDSKGGYPRGQKKIKTCTNGSGEDAVARLSDGASSITAAAQDSVKRSSFLTTQSFSKQDACSAPSIKCRPAHN